MVEGIDKARAKAIHYFFQKAMQNPEPLTNQEKDEVTSLLAALLDTPPAKDHVSY